MLYYSKTHSVFRSNLQKYVRDSPRKSPWRVYNKKTYNNQTPYARSIGIRFCGE
jgi:hypothetical protein